jgi:hypothetical protein
MKVNLQNRHPSDINLRRDALHLMKGLHNNIALLESLPIPAYCRGHGHMRQSGAACCEVRFMGA